MSIEHWEEVFEAEGSKCYRVVDKYGQMRDEKALPDGYDLNDAIRETVETRDAATYWPEDPIDWVSSEQNNESAAWEGATETAGHELGHAEPELIVARGNTPHSPWHASTDRKNVQQEQSLAHERAGALGPRLADRNVHSLSLLT